MSGRNAGVGIDEEEDVTPRHTSAGVPHRGDVPVTHRHHDGAGIPAYLGSGVSGRIVHHDDFERLPGRFRRRSNGSERARQLMFLVVRWNNE
jgi:hypothetical protein